ncbi:hypothetical protein ACP70R_047316 [Stipagrostis hirtigluma subsp. patula]
MAAATATLMRSSASAVVCRPVTASHVLRIDGYSHLAQAMSKGERVRSSAFDVAGRRWRLQLYPNGDDHSELERHVAVYLRLDGYPSGERVWASPKFSLLDRLGNPGVVKDAGSPGFQKRGRFWGFPDFISREELETPEYLKDDSVAIQCDVAVTTVRECSDHMVFISGTAEPVATEA